MCPVVLREVVDWERKYRTGSAEKHVSCQWKEVSEGSWPRLGGCLVGFTGRKASFPLALSEVSHV